MYFFINGILTNPANNFGWTDAACRWVERNTVYKADKYEYFCGAIFRRMFQQQRVKEVAKILREYKDFQVCLVGHSNGCDVITRYLRLRSACIEEAHLIAGATDPSFDSNGLNLALKNNRVEDVFVYGSQADHALRLARNTGWALRMFGLGYGDLGLVGPQDVACCAGIPERVHMTWKHTYGHSTWFRGEYFEKTMKLITGIK